MIADRLVGLWEAFEHFLYPSYCAECRNFLPDNEIFCSACRKKVQLVLTQEIQIARGKKVVVYAAARYEGAIQRLVRAKNHHNPTAARQLGCYILQQALCPWKQFDVLTPVPLHWKRRWFRGFNQAEVIARVLSEQHHLPLFSPIFRSRATHFQAQTVGRFARQANISGAFLFRSDDLKKQCAGKSFLLVDDLLTSGATVTALAELLYLAGAKSVAVVVAARA